MKTSTIYMQKNSETKPSLFINHRGELSLSRPVLAELLRAVIDKGLPFRFKAKGFSMSPLIKDGDIITVSPLSGKSVWTGHVGAFVHPNREHVVIHRVIGKKGGYFMVKGDNAGYTYELIPKANLLGCVVKVEGNGIHVSLGLGPERYLISFLSRIGVLSLFLSHLARIIRPFIKRSTE